MEPPARPLVKDIPPPPTFQKASAIPRPPTTSISGTSFRNASGGLPPIPKESPDPPSVASENHAPPAKAKPINRPATGKKAIVYNAVQRGNPVLKAIKNVGTEIGDIVADYQVGVHNGVLYLSLKYHRLHPEYIHKRIEGIKKSYNLRILLVLCDVTEHQQSIRELSKIAIINDLTVFVAWSNEEVAQYLITFKESENKSADVLKERIHQTYPNQLQHVLTSGKKVTKNDAEVLASQFGSFANIARQPSKILANVKGLGVAKVTSLFNAFNDPFLVGGIQKVAKSTSKPAEDVASSKDGNGKGEAIVIEGFEREKSGSPDWPEEDNEEAEPLSPPEGRSSKSPVENPASPPKDDSPLTGIWNDPLDDEDDEDDMPTSKRRRKG
ncbi:DNA excision repair protein ERCC-1, partial [Tremellales sp. Uapishka_1]